MPTTTLYNYYLYVINKKFKNIKIKIDDIAQRALRSLSATQHLEEG